MKIQFPEISIGSLISHYQATAFEAYITSQPSKIPTNVHPTEHPSVSRLHTNLPQFPTFSTPARPLLQLRYTPQTPPFSTIRGSVIVSRPIFDSSRININTNRAAAAAAAHRAAAAAAALKNPFSRTFTHSFTTIYTSKFRPNSLSRGSTSI